MSGLDALQAATSAVALAEVARQTALLIARICNAHREADELCKKTQNLSHVLKNVGRILENRYNRRGSGAIITEAEQEIVHSIESSLNLCETCLKSIRSKFEGLIEKDTSLSGMQVRERLKFVRSSKFIAGRERDISIQLSHLSIALQCLSHEDQADSRRLEASEREERREAAQYQQHTQAAFLQQLLILLQCVFQQAAAASAANNGQQATAGPGRGSAYVSPHESIFGRSIENHDSQPSLRDIFGHQRSHEEIQQQFEEYVFRSGRVEEIVEQEQDLADTTEIEILAEEPVREQLNSLDRPLSSCLMNYTRETTFLLAVKQGNVDLVNNLLNDGANTTIKDPYGWTVLHHAVFCLDERMVELLLDHENSECSTPGILNAPTKTGETALIYAVQRIHIFEGFNIAGRILAQPDCDINVSDGAGTALYYAVKEGKPSHPPRRHLVKLMAESGADVQAVHDQIPANVKNFEFLEEYITSTNDEQGRRQSRGDRRRSTGRGNSAGAGEATNSGQEENTEIERQPSRIGRFVRRFSRPNSTAEPPRLTAT